MRIDSHHSFSERYTLENLESILARNRFEGSILVCDREGQASRPIPAYVKAVIAPLNQVPNHALLRGAIHDFTSGDIPDLSELERRDLPLDVLHGLHLIPRIAERYPNLRMAIVHLGAPPSDDWPQALERAGALPQVVCKLSGLMAFGEPRSYVRHALSLFGPQRLMFGSDWPNWLPEYSWKASLAVFTQAIGAQSIEVREALLGGTAARFYAL